MGESHMSDTEPSFHDQMMAVVDLAFGPSSQSRVITGEDVRGAMMSAVPRPIAKPRSIRVPDREWEPAMRAAEDNGETLTAVIRRALREYAAQHAKDAR